jgi:hypothetical protein
MNLKLKKILSLYPDEGFIKADGFDDAIIGISTDGRLVYSIDTIIKILMKDMSEDDAYEHFYFNIDGAYLGEQTPLYINLIN